MSKSGGKTVWDVMFNIGGKSDESLDKAFKNARRQIQDIQKSAKQVGKDYQKFLGNASKLAGGAIGGIKTVASGAVKGVTAVAAGLTAAATAATVATVKMADGVAQIGFDAAGASAATGIAVEAYQELQYAMSQCGVESGTFSSALSNVSKIVNGAVTGNEKYQKALANVGISYEKMSKLAPEDQIIAVADLMGQMEDEAQKYETAIAVFGNSAGESMYSALKDGGVPLRALVEEARKTGHILDAETVAASEKYVKSKNNLTASLSGIKTQFISGSIGPLGQAFATIADAVQKDGIPLAETLGKKFGEFVQKLVDKLPSVIDKIREFIGEFKQGLTPIQKWGGKIAEVVKEFTDKLPAAIDSVSGIISTIKDGLPSAIEQFKDIITTVKDLVTEGVEFAGGWENIAKIAGGIAIAPTAISGFKTLFSAADLIKTTIGALPGIFGAVSGAASAGFGGIIAAAAPVVAIVAAIAAVGYVVYRNWDEIKGAATEAFDSIKQSLQPVIDGLKAFWSEHGEQIISVLKTIGTILEKVVVVVIKNVIERVKNMVTIFVGLGEAVWGAVKFIIDLLGGIGNVLIAVFTGDFDAIGGICREMVGKMGEDLKVFVGGVGKIFSGVVGKITGPFKQAFDTVKKNISGVVDTIKNLLKPIGDIIGSIINFTSGGAVDGAKNIIGAVTGIFGGGDKDSKSGKGSKAKHAEGGIFSVPHTADIAERGAEAVIPLTDKARGARIWREAGEIGGFSPKMTATMAVTASSGAVVDLSPVITAVKTAQNSLSAAIMKRDKGAVTAATANPNKGFATTVTKPNTAVVTALNGIQSALKGVHAALNGTRTALTARKGPNEEQKPVVLGAAPKLPALNANSGAKPAFQPLKADYSPILNAITAIKLSLETFTARTNETPRPNIATYDNSAILTGISNIAAQLRANAQQTAAMSAALISGIGRIVAAPNQQPRPVSVSFTQQNSFSDGASADSAAINNLNAAGRAAASTVAADIRKYEMEQRRVAFA